MRQRQEGVGAASRQMKGSWPLEADWPRLRGKIGASDPILKAAGGNRFFLFRKNLRLGHLPTPVVRSSGSATQHPVPPRAAFQGFLQELRQAIPFRGYIGKPRLSYSQSNQRFRGVRGCLGGVHGH